MREPGPTEMCGGEDGSWGPLEPATLKAKGRLTWAGGTSLLLLEQGQGQKTHLKEHYKGDACSQEGRASQEATTLGALGYDPSTMF